MGVKKARSEGLRILRTTTSSPGGERKRGRGGHKRARGGHKRARGGDVRWEARVHDVELPRSVRLVVRPRCLSEAGDMAKSRAGRPAALLALLARNDILALLFLRAASPNDRLADHASSAIGAPASGPSRLLRCGRVREAGVHNMHRLVKVRLKVRLEARLKVRLSHGRSEARVHNVKALSTALFLVAVLRIDNVGLVLSPSSANEVVVPRRTSRQFLGDEGR